MSDATLEAALRDLGRHVAWPETPDLVRGVRAELERGGEVRPLPGRPVRRAAVLAAAVVLVVVGAMAALSPGLRAAILRLFTLPGVRIEVEESPPPEPKVTPPEADITSSLGRPVTLAAARRGVDFPVVLPAPFGRPDEVYLRGKGSRALVTLAYGARPGLPLDEETTLSALLTQLRGRPTENLIKKVTPETSVTEVIVNGKRGYFVKGPHVMYVRGPGDRPVADAPRVAGNTLLWTRGPVTLRLEADLPLARVLEVARTVR